jgi:hypothetical protein
LQKERKFADDYSKRMSAMAHARWNKNNDIVDATAMPQQSVGNAPIPIKKEESKKTVSQNGGYATGRGVPPAGPALADDNLQKFMTRLAKELDTTSAGRGWAIVGSATDAADPMHGRCLLMCKVAAKKIGKGWPFNWPKDHAMFDRIAAATTQEQPDHDQQI